MDLLIEKLVNGTKCMTKQSTDTKVQDITLFLISDK